MSNTIFYQIPCRAEMFLISPPGAINVCYQASVTDKHKPMLSAAQVQRRDMHIPANSASLVYKVKAFIFINIQLLQRAHNFFYLTAIHVIERSIDLQLWIMVSGGWY